MAERLKITYLTTDDPIYLPAFFERVLERQADRTEAVYVVPPLYKRQTSAEAAIRYARTFGVGAAAQLSGRVLAAKLKRVSIAATCARRRVRCEEVGDVNAPGFLERLRREGAGVLVSVSCPQIFKRPLIQLPRHGILNIHGANAQVMDMETYENFELPVSDSEKAALAPGSEVLIMESMGKRKFWNIGEED